MLQPTQMPQRDLIPILQQLPAHLSERTRFLSNERENHTGDCVVYWTHHALRTEENPALDVAIHLARSLELPLLVYQGLSESYRFASDRHHTFILEAARELQSSYSQLGITYALHVERAGFRAPRLAQLSSSAAVIVTDDFPVEATRAWTVRLKAGRAAVVAVDTACVVPMKLVGKAIDRAFVFRDKTAKLYRERLDRAWPPCLLQGLIQADPKFDSVDLSKTSIAELVAECSIDHAVGPVADTRGGATAGYARWEAFKQRGLASYKNRRNSIEVDGVSRMSAYLHYGMVSPMRIAREASQARAEKYLDELLIWRELAYAFCFYEADVDSEAAIPRWAIATLQKHANDPRTVHSWERLARARTGQRLWDAAQRSLLKHGELHNNVRMTWGKALVQWSKDHRDALARLIDLNHRYALDGRDPASYGGLLWCLGQFDRPFAPEQPVFGSVRPRPLEEHERRVDMSAYEKRVDRAVYSSSPRIAVIGAGLGGLLCARTLADHGLSVTCFEKSGRASGRASTRKLELSSLADHGAQYFTIRDARLKPLLAAWIDDGHVSQWLGRIVELKSPDDFRETATVPRYVGTPAMNALGQHLAEDLTVQYQTRVARVETVASAERRYRLFDESDAALGDFDIVLWNCPPPQVAAFEPKCDWAERLQQVEMLPCWAVMVAFETRWSAPFDGAFINQGTLSWVARDSSKPRRDASRDVWVLHSSVDFAKSHLDSSSESVIAELLAELSRVVGVSLPSVPTASAHRWLYARPHQPLSETALWDPNAGLGACGDWCGGPRVEGAMLSGVALAGKVLGSLHERSDASRMLAANQLASNEAGLAPHLPGFE